MAQAQIPTRKRANGNELEGNGRSKRPRLPLFEEQKVHQLKGELSELRAYAEDSELLLSRTEQTLALLRRDMEMRAQLFSQEIRDLKLTINSSLCTVSPPDSPPSAPQSETPPIEVLRNSVPMRSSQPTTIPPPTTVPLSVDGEFDRSVPRNKMLSALPSLNGVVNLNGLDTNSMNLHNFNNLKNGSKVKSPKNTNTKQKSKSRRGDDEDSDSYESGSQSNFLSSSSDNSNSRKRSRLPPSSVAIFRHWLFNHLESPYPSEEEKEELAQKAGLRITQVNNWFTNARRRILPREDGDTHGRGRTTSNELF
jgi:hypothetical protein